MSSRPHAGIEESDERHLLVEKPAPCFPLDECEPKRPPRLAERNRSPRAPYSFEIIIGAILDGDVGEPDHLPGARRIHSRIASSTNHHDVAQFLPSLSFANSAIRHLLSIRKSGGVCAVQGPTSASREISGRRRFSGRRLLRPIDQFVAIDDLHKTHPLLVAVSEIKRGCLSGPGRDRAMQFGRPPRPVEPGSWPGQGPKIANFSSGSRDRRGRRSASCGRVRQSGAPDNQKRPMAGLTFPPAFVRILQAADPGDENRICGIGDVPDFVSFAAEGAQHVDRVAITLGPAPCRRKTRTICAPPPSYFPSCPGDVLQIFSACAGSVTSDDGGAVRFSQPFPVSGLTGLGNIVGATVMSDIGRIQRSPLVVDGRLITRLRALANRSPRPASYWKPRGGAPITCC